MLCVHGCWKHASLIWKWWSFHEERLYHFQGSRPDSFHGTSIEVDYCATYMKANVCLSAATSDFHEVHIRCGRTLSEARRLWNSRKLTHFHQLSPKIFTSHTKLAWIFPWKYLFCRIVCEIGHGGVRTTDSDSLKHSSAEMWRMRSIYVGD